MPLRGPAWATGPTTGGSPLPCGRRPPFAATAPSADAVGRYQRRDLPRSMVSFTKRGSRSRTDPPVTKARLAHTHTHIHTHAHKYTSKYIDVHIRRQSAGEGRYDAYCFNALPLNMYRCVYHTHTTHPRTVCSKARTPTHTGPNELKPCFLRWGPDPLESTSFAIKRLL